MTAKRSLRDRLFGSPRSRHTSPVRKPPALRQLETLEERVTPTTTPTYVDDNWAMIIDNAPFGIVSVGDIVQNNNDAFNPGSIIATYGVDGFGTVTTGPALGFAPGFAKISDAIAATTASGIVNVLEGNYFESDINVNKAVTIQGAGATTASVVVNPAFADSHSVLPGDFFDPGVHNGFVIKSGSVTIQTLTIDGGGKNYHGGVVYDYNAGGQPFSNVTITNLNVQHIWRAGIYLDGGAFTESSGQVVSNNMVNDVAGGFQPTGILMLQASGTVNGNRISNVSRGIASDWVDSAAQAPNLTIQSNNISAVSVGMNLSGLDAGSLVGGTPAQANSIDLTAAGASVGIDVIYAAGAVTVQNNTVTAGAGDSGIQLYQDLTAVSVSGNTLTGTGSATGILVTDDGSLFGEAPHQGTTAATLVGNPVSGFTTGLSITGGGPNPVSVTIGAGNGVSGGTTGLIVDGANTTLIGATLNNLTFTNQSGNSITLAHGAMDNTEINGTAVTFGSVTGATATFAQNYAIEDKITHAVDDATLGFVRVKAANVFVTPNSGSIQRAIDVATSGNTVHVQGGNYSGSVDTTTKGLTLDLGASPAQVNVTGNVTLHSGDTLVVELSSSATPGSGYDQLNATGNVTLGGANLSVSRGFSPAPGTAFTIVHAGGTLTPQFNGLPNGAVITLSGVSFAVTNNSPPGNVVLTVVPSPVIGTAFGVASMPLSGTTTLTFTITNPGSNPVSLTGVGFTDNLPAGLIVANPSGVTGTFGGGTVTAAPGSGTISLSGATLAPGPSLSFSVTVAATTSGVKTNSVTVTSNEGGPGNTATASLAVAAPATAAVAFGASSIPLNGTTSLTFTVSNPGINPIPLTGVGFTDNLPAGLVVATPNGLSNPSPGGGTATAVAGSSTITLSGASLAPGTSLTFSVNVTGTTAGVKSTSVTVSSTEGGTGAPSNTASLTVVAPPSVVAQQVNDGSAQRSKVTLLKVTFDKVVTLPANPANAFQLTDNNGVVVPNVVLNATVDNTSGVTVATITFTGSAVVGASLPDGRYVLRTLASQVTDSVGQHPTADATLSFFRFFGDSNGDGRVDNLDFALLKTAFNSQVGDANYRSFFDYDGSGKIDNIDLAQFKIRLTQGTLP